MGMTRDLFKKTGSSKGTLHARMGMIKERNGKDLIEEKNKMGKTRDHFKKIRDSKETFHAKMGTIKDRNGMDLTEV